MLNFLFGNKGKDIKALLSSSLKLFGEREVRVPSFRRFWLATFNRLYVLCAVLFIVYGWHQGLGILMIPAGIFVLFPAAIFYNVRMKACQTWAVYRVITQGSSSFPEAKIATAKVKWSLRLFALVELLIATEKHWEGEGPAARLARSLLSALETVFDVVEDLLLPAVVIEEKGISDVAAHLADLKKNVPAALTGAFGLDLFGGAISNLTWFLHLALFAFSVAIGLALAPFVPASISTALPARLVSWMPAHVCLIPPFVSMLVSSLLNRTLRIFVSSLKDVYFSVFYTSINRPLEIRQELRESVTNYLTLQDTSYFQSIKDALAREFPTLAAGPAPVLVREAAAAITISKVFQDALRGGRSLEQIRDFLKTKGYTDSQIQTVIERYKQ